MFLIFTWLLFAIIVGAIAAAGGRGFFGYFIVSIFLSPIVSLVILIAVSIVAPKR